jgi:hypothetical protein
MDSGQATASHMSCETGAHIHRFRFTRDEDEKLRWAMNQRGVSNWDQVIEMSGLNRNAKQVRERWRNYLNPAASAAWTSGELFQLGELHREFGNHWAAIGQVLGKPSIQVRNQCKRLIRHRAITFDVDEFVFDPEVIDVSDCPEVDHGWL